MSEKEIVFGELFKLPQDQWLEVGWQLNHWHWPDVLKHVRPEWWVDKDYALSGKKYAYMRYVDIPKAVRNAFSEKEILYYHNVVKGCGGHTYMTESEFEEWWNRYHGGYKKKRSFWERLFG